MVSRPLLLLLGGCWLSGDEVAGVISGEADADTDADSDADADTDTDADSDADVVVTSVDPPYGPSGGGTEVTVIATGVDGDLEVRFGTAAATVVGIDGDVITVTSPAGVEGYADVTVASHGKEDALTDAFHYWQDGEGLAGAIGEYSWYSYQGGYWGDGADYGDAYVWFVRPADVRYEDFWGGSLVDKCTRSPSIGSLEFYDVGTDLTLVSDLGTNVSLPYVSAGEFAAELTASQWLDASSYRLEMPGASPWPALEIDDFVLTPGTIAITDPYVDGDSTLDLDYVTQSFPLAWSGPYDGDYAVALLIRYNATVPVDYVYCHLNDDGAFTVPSSVWSGWSTAAQLTIVVGRVSITSATLPHNGADIEVAGVHYAVGAVWTY